MADNVPFGTGVGNATFASPHKAIQAIHTFANAPITLNFDNHSDFDCTVEVNGVSVYFFSTRPGNECRLNWIAAPPPDNTTIPNPVQQITYTDADQGPLLNIPGINGN
ncbi:hypothetical protein GGF41_001822 [Coemansia sp. RSA 2531]|nr:hypothetical protein GGF41_001822 [Coemansia sp. RSA 2531]